MTLGENFHTSSFPQVGIGVKTLLQMQIIFSSRKFEKNSSGILWGLDKKQIYFPVFLRLFIVLITVVV